MSKHDDERYVRIDIAPDFPKKLESKILNELIDKYRGKIERIEVGERGEMKLDIYLKTKSDKKRFLQFVARQRRKVRS